MTWYESNYAKQIPMTSLKLRADEKFGYPGRTYKFFNGTTVFPFGYGLSYTQFKYKTSSSGHVIPVNIKLEKRQVCHHINYTDPQDDTGVACPAVLVNDLQCKEKVAVRVAVKNIGKRDGEEVVIAYSKPPVGIAGTHMKQVVGFERVFVAAGRKTDARFEFDVCRSFSIVDSVGYKVLPEGVHGVLIGDGDKALALQVKISYHH